MPTIITTINGSRIGCPSYHYANSRYLFEIRSEVVNSVLTILERDTREDKHPSVKREKTSPR